MSQKILVPVDASPIGKIIFEKALSFASSTGSDLMLLHVLSMDDDEAPEPATFTGEYTRNRITGDYQTRAGIIEQRKQQWEAFKKKRLESIKAMGNEALKQNVNTEIVQVSGNPARKICEQVQKHEVDLIIMGSRGVSALEEIILGSVSSYVVHHVSCSVLIVRTLEKDLKWQKSLVAVDSSPIAKQVFAKALNLAKSTGSTLTLLQVLSLNDFESVKSLKNEALETIKNKGLEPANVSLEIMKDETLKAMKNEALEVMKNEAIAADVNTDVIQMFGSPGKSICEQARASEADLIIMGSRGLSGLQELLLGSVSNYVIHHAFCSVFIYRTPKV